MVRILVTLFWHENLIRTFLGNFPYVGGFDGLK